MTQHSLFSLNVLSLFESGKKIDYKKGEFIIRAGDRPQGVYCIIEGCVKAYTITDNGEENIHIIYRPGEIFPILWLFNGGVVNAYFQASSPVRVWRVARRDVLDLIKTDPAAQADMMTQAVSQLQLFICRVDNLLCRTARARIAYRLIFLASRFGLPVQGGTFIDMPITHHDIANSINLARETVSREIERLEDQGLVLLQNHRILIPDLDALRVEAGDSAVIDLLHDDQ